MTEPATVIDGLLQRQAALTSFLREHNELSLALESEFAFKKLFVMSCGSFFEERIVNGLALFASSADSRLANFVKKKALERQFHTLFDWDAKNVNKFLSLFGDVFKTTTSQAIDSDAGARAGMQAFLELCRLRNVVAHSNLASISVEKTVDELQVLYRSAWSFVRDLINRFGVDCADDVAS